MNGVLYLSYTGQSKKIAEYFAERTGFDIFDISDPQRSGHSFDTAIFVFPVHCQNIPEKAKSALEKLCARNLVIVATYGKMCFGNVLYEIRRKYRHNIVAAAYVPTKHSYLKHDCEFTDFAGLTPVIEKLNVPSPVEIPRSYKNPFSDIFKGLRSRIGVKIRKSAACDNCGLCETACDFGAIKNGKTNGRCIRCLKCVSRCPSNALDFSLAAPMRMYLCKKKIDSLVIYV